MFPNRGSPVILSSSPPATPHVERREFFFQGICGGGEIVQALCETTSPPAKKMRPGSGSLRSDPYLIEQP